jgi:hypothetical protein
MASIPAYIHDVVGHSAGLAVISALSVDDMGDKIKENRT